MTERGVLAAADLAGMMADEHHTDEKMTATLGVVIINYRTPDLVRRCIDALGPQLAGNDARAVIVDNFSDDGSADAIDAYLSEVGANWKNRVTLIRSPENTGFSGGNNIGIAAIDAEFYLLLNSDALVRPCALESLIASARAHPRAGIIGPRLEDEDGTAQISCFHFISPMSEFLSAAETGPLDKMFARFVVPRAVVDAPVESDWVSFACVLVRRAAIDDAGLMDEGFFMYFEDADYCHAMKRAGWASLYDPSARVVHLRGGSSPVKSSLKAKKRPPAYYYASRTRYFRKNYSPLGLYLANIGWLKGRAIARLRALFGKPAPLICEHQGADHWLNWRDQMGDRHAPKRD
ncbi:MAG: glycosyltransferase family 2 protein [Parvularculaceae bacterium]